MKKWKLLSLALTFVFMLSGCDYVHFVDQNVAETGLETNQEVFCNEHVIITNGDCSLLEHVAPVRVVRKEETKLIETNKQRVLMDAKLNTTEGDSLFLASKEEYEEYLLTGDEHVFSFGEGTLLFLKKENGEIIPATLDNGEQVKDVLYFEQFGDYGILALRPSLVDSMTFSDMMQSAHYNGLLYFVYLPTGKMQASMNVKLQTSEYVNEYVDETRYEVTALPGEPVYISQVEKTLDDSGNIIENEVSVMALDENGDPIRFIGVPYAHNVKEEPILDEMGNEIFDANNNPLSKKVITVFFDENQNPMLSDTFEATIIYQNIVKEKHIDYYIETTPNELTDFGQRYLDFVLWHHKNKEVSPYLLSENPVLLGEMGLYFTSWNELGEEVLQVLSYDETLQRLTIKDVLNLTKAGFDEWNVYFDITRSRLILDMQNEPIIIYDFESGISTIKETEHMNIATINDSEVLLVSEFSTYQADLDYWTNVIAKLDVDGNLITYPVTLNPTERVCIGDCLETARISIETSYGISDYYVNLLYQEGEEIASSMTIEVVSMKILDDAFICEDVGGCWKTIQNDVVDASNNVILTTYESEWVAEGEKMGPLYIQYRLDENTNFEYQTQWKTDTLYCDNEIGCVSGVSLYDPNNEIYLYQNTLIKHNDPLLTYIDLTKSLYAEYNYQDEGIERELCLNIDGCWDHTVYNIYNEENELLISFDQDVYVKYGYRAPAFSEITVTEDALSYQTISYEEVMTSPEDSYVTYVSLYLEEDEKEPKYIGAGSMIINEGDPIISSIIVNRDQITQTKDTQNCIELEGCTYYTSSFEILDQNNNPLNIQNVGYYELPYFIPYGESIPFAEFFVTYKVTSTSPSLQYPDPWVLNQSRWTIIKDNLYFIQPYWNDQETNVYLLTKESDNSYHLSTTNLPTIDSLLPLSDYEYIGTTNSNSLVLIQINENQITSFNTLEVDGIYKITSIKLINEHQIKVIGLSEKLEDVEFVIDY